MAASDRLPNDPEKHYMRLEFDHILEEIPQGNRNYLMIMEPDEYVAVMQEVKKLKRKKEHTGEQTRYLECYNIKIVGLRERLYMPKAPRGFPKCDRYFVHTEEVFDILQDIHESTKHGSNKLMERIIDRKYVNITHDMISKYVSICRKCQRKKQNLKMRQNLRIMFKIQMLRRGEVNLMDVREYKDKQFKFILCYRDNMTNFTLLRAVRTTCIKEVAHVLLDFFAIFGAPCVLQSPHGRSFMHEVVLEMIRVWPSLRIAHSEMIRTEANTRANEIRAELIQDFVKTWLDTNEGTTLYQAVRYAQMVVNMAPADSGPITSYELMFKKKMQFGINTELGQYLPLSIHTQETMDAFIETWPPCSDY